MSSYKKWGDVDFESGEDVILKLKEWASNRYLKKIPNTKIISNKGKVNATIEYWLPIMKNFDEIFRGLYANRNFNYRQSKIGQGSYIYEGIWRMCGSSRDKVLRERFKKLVKVPMEKKNGSLGNRV
jgi:hypothetical protein